MRNVFRWTIGGLCVLLLALSSTAYTVREGHEVVVTRFGRPVRAESAPGLHWKFPWPIDQAAPVDLRSRVVDTPHNEVMTQGKEPIIVLSFAQWRVADALLFHRAVGSVEQADDALTLLLSAKQGATLGNYPLQALASVDPDTLAIQGIEEEVRLACDTEARENYGIEVEAFSIRRLSFPKDNIAFVFNTMRAERNLISGEIRSRGEEEAANIRGLTDLEVQEIQSASIEEAARIRGESEAAVSKMLAEAAEKDLDFFRFWTRNEAAREISWENASMVIRSDMPPWNVLMEGVEPEAPSARDTSEGDDE